MLHHAETAGPRSEGSDSALLSLAAPHTATFTAARARTHGQLTVAPAVAVAALIVAAGAGIDVMIGRGPGSGLTVAYVVACAVVALRLRLHVVGAAVIAAPLLFAAGTAAIAWASGEAAGFRQLMLDVATSLALSAPVLFGGTALTVAIAVVRLALHVVRRPRREDARPQTSSRSAT